MQKPSNLSELVHQAAKRYNLTVEIIAALIMTESSGKPNAQRYEPEFKKRYLDGKEPEELPGYWPKGVNHDEEIAARATSWGLMQLMGQVARELGFREVPLGKSLCDPATNIDLGCKLFRKFLNIYGQNLRLALLRWNGGANKTYPDKVLAKINTAVIELGIVTPKESRR